MCLRALLFRKEQLLFKGWREVNWGMLVVAVLMFIFASFDGECNLCSSKSLC